MQLLKSKNWVNGGASSPLYKIVQVGMLVPDELAQMS